MRPLWLALHHLLATAFGSRIVVQLGILALRHQRSVDERNRPKRLRIQPGDRVLWSWLARAWPRSPWQNPYAERVIGTLRRECLDNVVILHEQHLRRTLQRYIDFYHRWRVHRSLATDAPEHRPVQLPERGEVVEFPDVNYGCDFASQNSHYFVHLAINATKRKQAQSDRIGLGGDHGAVSRPVAGPLVHTCHGA